jgi:hypothetical protein
MNLLLIMINLYYIINEFTIKSNKMVAVKYLIENGADIHAEKDKSFYVSVQKMVIWKL